MEIFLKVLNKLMIGAAALVSLTGCARGKGKLKEVDADTFIEKAKEAWKDVPYTEATVNGSYEITYNSVTSKIEFKDVKIPIKDGAIE